MAGWRVFDLQVFFCIETGETTTGRGVTAHPDQWGRPDSAGGALPRPHDTSHLAAAVLAALPLVLHQEVRLLRSE